MDKIILITGASRGIGAATALLAASKGFVVAVNYKENQAAADAIVNKIIAQGGRAEAFKADVSVEAEIIKLFHHVDEKLGVLSALVNNAGILEKQGPLVSMNGTRLQRIFTTNAVGPMLCCIEAVKRMSTKNGGSGGAIVNVSSSATKHGAAFEYVDYAASKGAIDVMTAGLSKEVAGEGIRVNAVRPGVVYTDIHATGGEPGRVDRLKSTIPMQRGGYPEEVAAAIMWLISEEASFCAGTVIDLTGGR